MAFNIKDWQDAPSLSTPVTAASLEDMETRLSEYTDSEVANAGPVINVKAEGAVGDGTTNDTAAVQAAIDLAISENRGTVFFPAGTYSVSPLTIANARISLVGENKTRTRLKARSGSGYLLSFTRSGTEGVEYFQNHSYDGKIASLYLDGNARTLDMGGVNLDLQDQFRMDDVRIEHFAREGIKARSLRESIFTDVYVAYCGDVGGLYGAVSIADTDSTGTLDGSNNVHFYGLRCVRNFGTDVLIRGYSKSQGGIVRQIYFWGAMLHGPYGAADYIAGTVNAANGASYSVTSIARGALRADIRDARNIYFNGTRFHDSDYGQPLVRAQDGPSTLSATSTFFDGCVFGQPEYKTATVTLNGTNDTISATGLNLATGARFRMSSTGGIGGLSSGTDYWAIRVDANTIKPAISRALAIAGTPFDLGGNGSGTITLESRDIRVEVEGSATARIESNCVTDTVRDSVNVPFENTTGDGTQLIDGSSDSHLLEVNAKAYGAIGDGVADDRASIQAAINAAGGRGIVYLPKGTYYLNSGTNLTLPMGAEGLTIRGAGIGATVIKLSANCPTFVKPNRTTDHQTFQNFTMENLTVDGNNIPIASGSNNAGVIFSTIGVNQRLNVKNVTLRRIKQINVPVNSNTATSHRRPVHISSAHTSGGEATQNTIENILCEDLDLEGGNSGIEVYGTGVSETGINIWLDRIVFNRCRHDMLRTETTFFAHTHFHIGSRGTGNRARIRDCWAYGGSDCAVEVDSMTDVVVEGTVVEGIDGNGFYFRNYNYPLSKSGSAPSVNNNSLAQQKFIVRDCRAVFAPGRAGRTGRGFMQSVETGGTDLPMGETRFIDCTVVADTPTMEPNTGLAFMIMGRSRYAHLERCYALYTNISLTATSGTTKNPSIFYVDQTNGPEHLYVTDCNAYASGTVGSSATEINALTGLYINGISTGTNIKVNGFHWQMSFTNWNSAVAYAVYLGAGTVFGTIDGVKLNFTGASSSRAWKGIGVNGTASLTPNLMIQNSDLSAVPVDLYEVAFLGVSNAANVRLQNLRLRSTYIVNQYTKGFVNHGSTAGTARPVGYPSVEWYGSVQPTNMASGDTWWDTDG